MGFSIKRWKVGTLSFVPLVNTAGDVVLSEPNSVVFCKKTVGSATAVSLPPTPKHGDLAAVIDANNDAGTYNITITDPASYTIDGAASLVIAQNRGRSILIFNGVSNEWNVLASLVGAATFDTITANAIVGGDSSLGITGAAAATASSAGGSVPVAGAAGGATSGVGGDAGDTGGAGTAGNSAGGVGYSRGGAGQGSAAGGVAENKGGAGGTTGAGGAANNTGGAGGATSGVGGAATNRGGAGTAGNSAGGVADTTGGAGQGSAAGGIGKTVGGAGGATGVGGKGQLTGGAGGATSGAGGAAEVTGGAGTNANANGGPVVIAGGAANGSGINGIIVERSVKLVAQGAPAAKTVSATLTAAEVLAGIITVNQGGAGASALQLPAGSALDTAMPDAANGDAFDFSVINISTVAAESASLTTNTNLTLVGDMDIQANSAATTKSAGRFRLRRTSTATWSCYRLA